MPNAERSYERIDPVDLARLSDLATRDREEFFAQKPQMHQIYGARLIFVALCQGAALHYVDGKTGVRDFDVWSFYSAHPEKALPARRKRTVDFGPSKFGRHPADERFLGRRVDLFLRSIPSRPEASAIESLRAYLSLAATQSAKELSKKAVVLIDPHHLRGQVVWPLLSPNSTGAPFNRRYIEVD